MSDTNGSGGASGKSAGVRGEPCTGGYGCGITVTYWRCRKHSTGCTCQYGPMTPQWYTSVETCPLHASSYDRAQTPQWWIDGENSGWRTTASSKKPRWWNRLRASSGSLEVR